MAGTSNSITTHNVLSGVLNADNVISGLVNTAFNPAYALVTQAGAQIVLFINSNDYKMYAQLKDKSGNVIYTSNIIDLPLETMVVDGRYDSNTKKLILVLDNGNEIEVPLEALINGLVNEDDLIANYYDKDEIDALLNGYWTKIELTQEDIDNWNAKQEYLNQGDGIEISADTILKGNTSQESTTGKNLLNLNVSPIYTAYASCSYNEPILSVTKGSSNNSFCLYSIGNASELNGKTLKYTGELLTANRTGRAIIGYADDDGSNRVQTKGVLVSTGTFEITGLIDGVTYSTKKVVIWIYADTTDQTSTGNILEYKNLMVRDATITNTDYEPYTNGPAPNPDYPYPVNVVTGDNEVKVEGKNLFSGWIKGKGINSTTGEETSESNKAVSDYIPVDFSKNANYYVSGLSLTLNSFVNAYNSNKQSLGRTVGTAREGLALTSRSFTSGTPQGTGEIAYIRITQYVSGGGSIDTVDTLQTMLNIGSTASEYEEHKEQTYPINLGSMELCKIGDYQDYIYKDSDKWYLHKEIGKKIVLESEILAQTDSYTNVRYFKFNKETNDIDYNKYNETSLFYSHAKLYNGYDYDTASAIGKILPTPEAARYWVGFSKDTTLSQAKEKLTGSILYYPLKIATNTEITDTTLISQLNALTTGFSNNWVENISQTNTDLPFEIKYNNKNLTISASSNLVRDTDYATNQTGGVIKTGGLYGTGVSSGILMSVIKTYEQYQSSSNMSDYGFVSKGTLENVITGKELTNKTYVDAADAAFESELFDDGVISIEDSTEANINNTMNKSQLKIDLKGNTSQESTTGKNLIGTNYITGVTVNDTTTNDITIRGNWASAIVSNANLLNILEPNTTYTINYKYKVLERPSEFGSNNSVYILALYDGGSGLTFFGETQKNTIALNTWETITKTFTTPASLENYRLIAYDFKDTNNTTTGAIEVSALQIEKGSTATEYERYTGGNRAPNPDYPYPVNVVTGDNSIKVEGKNLFNPTDCNLSSTNYTLKIDSGEIDLQVSSSNNYFDLNGGIRVGMWENNYANVTDYHITPADEGTYIFKFWFNQYGGEGTLNTFFDIFTNQRKITEFRNPSTTTSYIEKAITLNEGEYIKQVGIWTNGENTSIIIKGYIQLEKNSTATTYEPYIGKSYPIYLGVENLWNTDKLKDGFIPASGTYPINNTSFPNAKYLLVYLYKGQSLTIANQTDTSKRGRIRYIDKDTNLVIDNVRATTNAYYTSNFEGTDGFKNGTITALKDFILAFMTIDVADTKVNADVTYGTTPQYISDTPIELCKIGDYQDYLYKENDKWYKYGAIGKVVYTGGVSEEWIKNTNYSTTSMLVAQIRKDNINGSEEVYSNYFKYAKPTVINSIRPASTFLLIGLDITTYPEVSNFQTWLSTHNTTVYYVLNTPTITEITDTTLIEQLDNLEKAYSYDTQTNISQTNQDKSFILDINAIADNVNGLKLENENQEYKTNKVIELSSNSTDDEYPSAKCVYDIVGNIEAVLAAMDSGSGV